MNNASAEHSEYDVEIWPILPDSQLWHMVWSAVRSPRRAFAAACAAYPGAATRVMASNAKGHRLLMTWEGGSRSPSDAAILPDIEPSLEQIMVHDAQRHRFYRALAALKRQANGALGALVACELRRFGGRST